MRYWSALAALLCGCSLGIAITPGWRESRRELRIDEPTPAPTWRSDTALPPPTKYARCWTTGVYSADWGDHWADRWFEGCVWDLHCDGATCTGITSQKRNATFPVDQCLFMDLTDLGWPPDLSRLPPTGHPVRVVQPGWSGL